MNIKQELSHIIFVITFFFIRQHIQNKTFICSTAVYKKLCHQSKIRHYWREKKIQVMQEQLLKSRSFIGSVRDPHGSNRGSQDSTLLKNKNKVKNHR
jgi:hypothetical protein